MRGFCESCCKVVDSVPDVDGMGGGDVCPECSDDVHPGVHIEGELIVDDTEDEYDVDQWLLNQE